MDDENALGPQPDINLLGQSMRTAATELGKFQNLPAIAAGEAILAAIQEMRHDLGERITRLERNLATRITTSDLNNTARVQNSYLLRASEPLSPFVDPMTGGLIAGFPATFADIARMSAHEVNTVMEQLGLQTAGLGLQAKKRRIRMHIG